MYRVLPQSTPRVLSVLCSAGSAGSAGSAVNGGRLSNDAQLARGGQGGKAKEAEHGHAIGGTDVHVSVDDRRGNELISGAERVPASGRLLRIEELSRQIAGI